MNGAHTATNPIFPGQPLPPGPFQDRYRRPLSPATVELLIQLQVLLVYARHLLGLLRQAVEHGCALLARCFGPGQASFVLTHFSRGILRAIALQRVLQAPAEDGQPDPAAGTPRKRTAPPAQPHAPRRPSPSQNQRPPLPTLRQLEAAIRRRQVQDVIADINRDLGAALSLCDARFGNALRDMAAAYRDTLANLFHAAPRREAVTADAPELHSPFAYPPQLRDAIRYIVGCLVAQQPVCGFPFTASPLGAALDGAQPP